MTFGASSAGAATATRPSGRVLVLVSQDALPYDQALEGFRRSLAQAGGKVEVTLENMAGDSGRGRARVARTSRDGTSVILALGGLASEAALQAPGRPPVVAAMVLRTKALRGVANATGVGLEFPVDQQLSWLRRLLPARGRVSVLFSPQENAERMRDAQQAADRLGLDLGAIEVRTPADIPNALERVARGSGMLWGITDSVVLSPESARGLLLFSFRNRIPVVGVSTNWVRAGALCGFDRDYVDVGSQAAEMVLAILSGTPAEAIPPAPPRKMCSALNLKTARLMQIEFSPEALKGACEVVR